MTKDELVSEICRLRQEVSDLNNQIEEYETKLDELYSKEVKEDWHGLEMIGCEGRIKW